MNIKTWQRKYNNIYFMYSKSGFHAGFDMIWQTIWHSIRMQSIESESSSVFVCVILFVLVLVSYYLMCVHCTVYTVRVHHQVNIWHNIITKSWSNCSIFVVDYTISVNFNWVMWKIDSWHVQRGRGSTGRPNWKEGKLQILQSV